MRVPLASVLMLLTVTATPNAAEDKALKGREDVTTAKERLVNKAADPQRVNDCKVPIKKRDAARNRSDACPHLQEGDETDVEGSGG